jgi:ABC-type branched-subunit amino acid transport system ATPase component
MTHYQLQRLHSIEGGYLIMNGEKVTSWDEAVMAQEGVSRSFQTESITKYTLAFGITH